MSLSSCSFHYLIYIISRVPGNPSPSRWFEKKKKIGALDLLKKKEYKKTSDSVIKEC